MTKHQLFVYGTLMHDYGNNRVMRKASMVGPLELPGKLYASGVPFFQHIPDADTYVDGELWLVDDVDLANCDRLEGYQPDNPHGAPDWYTRTTITHPIVGEVYAYTVDEAPSYADLIPSGSYRDYSRRLAIGGR